MTTRIKAYSNLGAEDGYSVEQTEDDILILHKSDGSGVKKTITDYTVIDAEMARLQAEYDSQEYARKREEEYPAIQELVVALYDTDDRAAIDAKRAAIKAKYPKPG